MSDPVWEQTKSWVITWAKEFASDDYMYGAPYSWWGKALDAGIISNDQYQEARSYYGNLWNYRGD